jgi:hypothetical protein
MILSERLLPEKPEATVHDDIRSDLEGCAFEAENGEADATNSRQIGPLCFARSRAKRWSGSVRF